jgi:peptide/nickel transport system permease protein
MHLQTQESPTREVNKMNQEPETQQLSKAEMAQYEKVIPMWKIVFTQFKEHRMAMIGLIVISLFATIAISADLISKITGLDPQVQNPLNRYSGVMTESYQSHEIREERLQKFIDKNPDMSRLIATNLNEILIHETATVVDPTEIRTEDQSGVVDPNQSLFNLVAKDREEAFQILGKINVAGKDEFEKLFNGFVKTHVFGTDELGRDVLIRLIYGTRVSMGVGLLVALSSALIGLLIGSMAGFYGGTLDALLMRLTDALLALPILPIQIIIAAVDLNKLPFIKSMVGAQSENIVKLVFILVMFSWMTTALLVRGAILSLREREFILAARTLGATDRMIIVRHLFPNVMAPLLVSVTLGVGESILFEAALSFLGLGIQQPTPSWGNMLFNAQDLITEAPFLAILPGLLILATTISFNYLGDGLQDAIDPKAVRR